MIHLYFIFIEVASHCAEYTPLRRYALKQLSQIQSLSDDDYLFYSRKYVKLVNFLRLHDKDVSRMIQFETNKQTLNSYVSFSDRNSESLF